MKRRVFFTFVPLLLVCILSAPMALAAGQRVVQSKPDLSFQGTTAVCSAICQGNKATDRVEATLTLYQGSTYISSWSKSGTGRVTLYGECTVQSGKTYRLELTHSINGTEQPVASATSRCP